MQKTILLTGATDGIGLETAKKLALQGHHILMHGRNEAKLNTAIGEVASLNRNAKIERYVADLSILSEVSQLTTQISEMHGKLDVIINNAGVFATPNTQTKDGLDVRFAVNTIAPYILTRQLLPLLNSSARVINLSSAAQAPVDIKAMVSHLILSDNDAYAQSKLALTMWTQVMAAEFPNGPVFVAVNPASFLASKMVKEAYGVIGNNLSIGADILVRAALSDEFANVSGQYFDNDIGKFAKPHSDTQSTAKVTAVMTALNQYL